jgi:hypothetical protein
MKLGKNVYQHFGQYAKIDAWDLIVIAKSFSNK